MITFRVLGPLVAEDERGPVELRGPRHRAVLARLLVARGRVVPVGQLVADLWTDPPDGAVGAVQTFVAALRKALEPDRPPRTPARVLVTAGPGYVLRAAAVDAWEFEAAVTASGSPEAVLAGVDAGLALWRGPAYADFADEPWARGEIARLDELRLLAGERRAAALLDSGRAASAVPDLEAQVRAHPWREDAWRLLALARYRAARQGEALDTLRRARSVLAEELGLDPGPGLRQLETDILAQAPGLTGAPVLTGLAATSPGPRRRAATSSTATHDVTSGGDEPVPGSRATPGPGTLVGRAGELAQFAAAAAAVRERGKVALVLVAGEAGAGKTALAQAGATHLADQGWTTAWGGNPEDDGLPAAWPWTRILAALPGPAPEPETGGDPAAARFRWHRAVHAHLTRHTPLLLVLDDLHLAGEETLALLASLVAEPGAILVVGTYRTTDVPGRLTRFLGRVARTEPTRIYLGGLPIGPTAQVVSALTGRDADPGTVRLVHRRSGGNPFFVRELARLLAAGGDVSSVPAGIRDVVRYRLATLPEPVRSALRHAAVLGVDVEESLLPGAGVLDALEVATARGFLVEVGPGRFRFAHALVRDTLYEDLSRSRRARWHANIAEALERARPDDVAALAHHFLHAEDPATAAKGARYARAAAEQAEHRFAPHQAARLWQAALDHAGDDPRERLTLLVGLVRALAVTGALAEARRHRAEALDLAEAVDDPALTAGVIAAFDVPAVWTESDDPALAGRIVEVTERTLTSLPGAEPAVRSRLLSTVALELRNTGGPRAHAAATEAEAIARGLADPAVLAFALNARFMQSFERAGGARRRLAIGTELVDLAARHALVTFEVLGHLILVQANSALADLTAADRHAAEAERLGDDYEIPAVSVLIAWYRAMRATIAGEPAEAAYRAVAVRLADSGMPGMSDGILGLALLCDRLRRGQPPRPDDFGPYEPWCRPLVLLAAGDVAGARAVSVPPAPRDLLFEARTCLHALAAVRLGDRETMTRLYAELAPAE
ncbi:BTAD domain-containing putative transcriptional regulator, partial [Actinophytocola sp.]|uniref:BTAD domain-containing putative transcriptional regulator n=1 Tax=Actinophytocola sp. TaxID=1872138 RepID=UPI00389A3B20